MILESSNDSISSCVAEIGPGLKPILYYNTCMICFSNYTEKNLGENMCQKLHQMKTFKRVTLQGQTK